MGICSDLSVESIHSVSFSVRKSARSFHVRSIIELELESAFHVEPLQLGLESFCCHTREISSRMKSFLPSTLIRLA